MRKVAVLLLSALLATAWFAPTAHAESTGYSLSVSAETINVASQLQCRLTTPEAAQKVVLYVGAKSTQTSQTPEIVETGKLWTFSIAFDAAGTKRLRLYAYDGSGKLLAKYPSKDVVIRVIWPLFAPAAQVALLEYDLAVLQATLAPGYKYKRYGFYVGTQVQAMTRDFRATTLREHTFEKLLTALLPETVYYFQPYAITSGGIRLTGEIGSFTTPAQRVYTVQDSMLSTTAEKYRYLFLSDSMYYTRQNPPLGYRTSAQAEEHMVSIRVPVWRKSGKTRKASTWKITVNRKLAANIMAIFEEIYALDIRFPIMHLRCFNYRTLRGPTLYGTNVLSHHSFGAAIDINKPYNLFYRTKDKRNPKNPYTIPNEVIAIFEKYGWAWGGNFACGLDTMHFQYLGLDLLPQ